MLKLTIREGQPRAPRIEDMPVGTFFIKESASGTHLYQIIRLGGRHHTLDITLGCGANGLICLDTLQIVDVDRLVIPIMV